MRVYLMYVLIRREKNNSDGRITVMHDFLAMFDGNGDNDNGDRWSVCAFEIWIDLLDLLESE